MGTIRLDLELDEGLAALLRQMHQPMERAARELMVMELYRRHSISTGKAAEVLGMPLLDFIQHASRLGIPYFDMTADEWEAERRASERL